MIEISETLLTVLARCNFFSKLNKHFRLIRFSSPWHCYATVLLIVTKTLYDFITEEFHKAAVLSCCVHHHNIKFKYFGLWSLSIKLSSVLFKNDDNCHLKALYFIGKRHWDIRGKTPTMGWPPLSKHLVTMGRKKSV